MGAFFLVKSYIMFFFLNICQANTEIILEKFQMLG